MSLSCHEQVCLKWGTFREIRPDDGPMVGELLSPMTGEVSPETYPTLNILIHEVINSLYYEY